MGNFNRGGNDRFGGRGGKPSFGGKGGPRKWEGGFNKEMFKAVCAECSRPCEVPFRPTQGKPVFCNECFATQGGSLNRMERAPRREFENRDFKNRNFDNRPAPRSQFDNVNKSAGNGEVLKMIETLGAKIESLTKAVASLSIAKEAPVKESASAPVVEVKKVAEKTVVAKKAPAKKTQSKKKK